MAFNSDLLGPRGQPGRGQLGFSSRDSDWAGVSQAGLWSEAQEEAQGSDLPPPPLQPGWELVKIGCRRIADLRGSEDPTEVRPPTPLAASRPRLRYHGSRNWSFSPAYRDLFSVSKSSPHLLSTDRLPAGWAVWDPGHPWWSARPPEPELPPCHPQAPPRSRSRPATPSPPSAPGSGSILAPVCRAPGTQAVLRGSHHPEGAPGRAHLPFVAPACPACTSLATRPRWPSPPRRPAPVLPSPPRAPLCLQTLRSGRSCPNQSPFLDFPGARPFIRHPRPRGRRGAETPAGRPSPARPLKREAAARSAPCGPHVWDGRPAPGGPQMGTVKPEDG